MNRHLTCFENDVMSKFLIKFSFFSSSGKLKSGSSLSSCSSKRLFLCEPGMTRKQPFSMLESSTAIHTVQVASGRIGQYSPSWCQGVVLPVFAGLAKKLSFQSIMSSPRSCDTQLRISVFRAKLRKPMSDASKVEQKSMNWGWCSIR